MASDLHQTYELPQETISSLLKLLADQIERLREAHDVEVHAASVQSQPQVVIVEREPVRRPVVLEDKVGAIIVLITSVGGRGRSCDRLLPSQCMRPCRKRRWRLEASKRKNSPSRRFPRSGSPKRISMKNTAAHYPLMHSTLSFIIRRPQKKDKSKKKGKKVTASHLMHASFCGWF